MALSEDQKAMLRLLAQRGEQGYEDLSALLGIGAEEVHAKALEAVAELETEGIPAPAIPAPPTQSAAPKKQRERPQAPREPAEPASPKPAAATPPPRSGFELPSGKAARAAIAASALAVLAFVLILLLSGGDGSDDGTSASNGTTASAETAREAAAATPNLTQAVLSPVDGGEAEGRAIFGRLKKNVILQVQAEGLEPSPPGSSYTVWLYKSPQLALRIGSVEVSESGGIAAQFPIPTELLAYVAGGAFDQIDISLTDKSAYEAEIAVAKREERLPAYVGEDVLRGPIAGPAIEAARRAERK